MVKLYLADNYHPYLTEVLQAKGFMPVQGKPLCIGSIDDAARDCSGIIVSTKSSVSKEVIDALPHVKLIACAGSGMDYVDTAYAKLKNITCINAPEGNSDSVAEHAIGMIIALLHNMSAYNDIINGEWHPYDNRPTELKGKTVGIIGYGNTGSALAKRLSVFGCTILAYDKYKSGYGNSYVTESTWNDIYAHADILSMHVPLTEETHHLINDKALNLFKKEIIFINTSRGEVVDSHALINALQTGKLKAAGLDVVEDENNFTQSAIYAYINNEKQQQGNVHRALRLLLTPHIAGKSIESRERIAGLLADKIAQWKTVNTNIAYEIN